MRGATKDDCQVVSEQVISIHAPHARSDSRSTRYQTRWTYFNPRSSCEERHNRAPLLRPCRHFNPRSSCEERQKMTFFCSIWTDFNPRSSCEERPCRNELVIRYNRFQSTLLMRGATLKASAIGAVTLHFNPRSSCEERRDTIYTDGKYVYDFNPRSSCEERPLYIQSSPLKCNFNPRSSCEERLGCSLGPARRRHFNPRSSCEERRHRGVRQPRRPYFNPRSSCEERQSLKFYWIKCEYISIHAPHARSDKMC